MSNSNIKYKVYLSDRQRQQLWDISRNGREPEKKILHAQVLLMADQDHPEAGWTDAQISEAKGTAHQHNCQDWQRLCEEWNDSSLRTSPT